ncbi:unnamed protein product [Calicophoron daubneyi]|uniref:DUF4200 domain-containing protein n=1 Tax=Calicophoron daubneyi TaxID=300641 RepID=A0AAV2TB16_CALDB
MQHVQQRREEFEKKECQLKESLMKFDKFFKENDDKRMRALKKLAFERGLQRQKQKEIAALKSGNELLKEEKQKLENRMKSLVKYRNFLEATVKESDDFNEISEVITRYEALSANLEDLKSTDQANNEIAESLSVDLHQYKEEKEEEKLTLTNELVDLRKMLEKYQAESRSRESVWEHSKNAEARRICKLNTLKGAINNMYRLVRMYQRYGDEAQENDLKGQLAVPIPLGSAVLRFISF